MKTAISLGCSCFPAMYGVHTKLRERKSNGYKTCPFDLMLTNIEGVIDCIKTDFKYLLDSKYLICRPPSSREYFPINTKYDFRFNHEGFDNFCGPRSKQWPPEYRQKFLDRYNPRVDNFRYYCNNAEHITFLTQEQPKTNAFKNKKPALMIEQAIQEAYPKLNFDVIVIPPEDHPLHPNYNGNSEWATKMGNF